MANKFDVHETVPYIPNFVGCASKNYAYGFRGESLLSFNDNLALSKTGAYSFSPALTAYQTFASPHDGHDGIVFIVGSVDGGSTFDLYRTDDFGDTFTRVIELGGEGAAQIVSVWMLQKGFCAAKINGQDVFLAGEYNVNASRTAGWTNDRVRIFASYDLGMTWETIATWNTDGTNYCRHIHGIVQDASTGMIYVLFGDNESGGMIRWDGVADWQDNTSFVSYGEISGFKSLPYTTDDISITAVDLVFTDNYIHWFADNGVIEREDTGIWRAEKDFSNPVRIDHSIDSYMPCDGWSGVVTRDGKILFTNVVYKTSFNGPSTDFEIKVWLSEDEGATYTIIGRIGCKVNDTVFCNISLLADSIIISMQGGAGKAYNCAVVIRDTGERYDEDVPVCFHPVFWVSTTGVDDAYAGYTPAGWRTPKYALSSRMAYGARLIIEDGEYESTQLTQAYSSSGFSSNPGDPDAVNVIEGRGINTHVFLPDADVNTSLFYANIALPVLFTNVWISSRKASSNTLNIDTKATSIRTHKCKIGDDAYTTGDVVKVSGNYKSRQCKYYAGNNSILHTTGTGSVDISNFTMVGGSNQINFSKANTKTLLINFGTLYGYTQRGIINQSGGVLSGLRVRNLIFKGASGASADIFDYSANSDNYNNCMFCGTIVPAYVTGGSNSIKTPDPLFVDEIAQNFSLQRTSLCINRGVAIDGVATDYDGNTRLGTPDIGAYEHQDPMNAFCGHWTPFDTSMPALTLSPTAPGKLKQVQEWRKVASAREIGKY